LYTGKNQPSPFPTIAIIEPNTSHAMASRKVVETIYGKYSKYEIVRKSGVFSTKFYVRKDGDVVSGTFSSLKAAVEWAKSKK